MSAVPSSMTAATMAGQSRPSHQVCASVNASVFSPHGVEERTTVGLLDDPAGDRGSTITGGPSPAQIDFSIGDRTEGDRGRAWRVGHFGRNRFGGRLIGLAPIVHPRTVKVYVVAGDRPMIVVWVGTELSALAARTITGSVTPLITIS